MKNQPTFLITSLRKIISVSFIVKSSSLVPDFKSLTTEGLMHSGGTRSRVRIKSQGLPASGFIKSRGISSAEILLKRCITTNGFKFSYNVQKITCNFNIQGQKIPVWGYISTCSHPFVCCCVLCVFFGSFKQKGNQDGMPAFQGFKCFIIASNGHIHQPPQECVGWNIRYRSKSLLNVMDFISVFKIIKPRCPHSGLTSLFPPSLQSHYLAFF